MRYFYILLALFLASCSCSSDIIHGRALRIGIDRLWYPIDFGEQNAYVNGFTEDLLNEMSKYSGLEFELVYSNWDALKQGLKQGKYDAILTSIPPHEYNKAKYDFSSNFLDVGPVLIVSVDSKKRDLARLKDAMVGILVNDPAARVLEKHPSIVIRQFQSIPLLLDSVTKGEIDGALLHQILAVQYVSDLYRGVLMISSEPLTDEGLHMMGRPRAVRAFDKSLKSLTRKSTLKNLLKKWELSI